MVSTVLSVQLTQGYVVYSFAIAEWGPFLTAVSTRVRMTKGVKLQHQPGKLCGPPHSLAQARDGMSKGDVEAALKQVPFKLGGGKTELSLFEVVPSYAVQVHIV